jgi:hypothetical protein
VVPDIVHHDPIRHFASRLQKAIAAGPETFPHSRPRPAQVATQPPFASNFLITLATRSVTYTNPLPSTATPQGAMNP